jgi:threonine synthase
LLEFTRNQHLSYAQLVSGSEHFDVWRYAKSFPIDRETPRVTLGEGGTPLLRSSFIGKSRRFKALYFKNEGQNPTGSFKDRGMTVAVTRALEAGASTLICASTGNTSASLAAYAARAGLRAVVLLPAGKVARGKLIQAAAHGAKILKVDGDFERALEIVREVAAADDRIYLVNSINPYRVEGQKTAAYEIYEQLGRKVPDCVVLPVGNAGNISAVWKGFEELREWGVSKEVPVMVGVQASGAAPIVEAITKRGDSVEAWREPSTVASAIRIGNPVSWKKAVRAIRKSGGTAISVEDEEIMKARDELASKEGIFLEPASAAPVAALSHLHGLIRPDDIVVCIGTGSGLKDPETVKLDPNAVPQVNDASSLSGFLSRRS